MNVRGTLTLAALTVSVSGLGAASEAATIAYIRFEEGAAGQQVQPNAGPEPVTNPVTDFSGNGNNFRTFNESTGPIYTTNVPAGTIPQTDASNALAGGFYRNPNLRDIYSAGAVGGGDGGTTLNDHDFQQFTIEVSVRFYDLGGFQTFVGKDPGAGTPAGPLGNVYFTKRGDDNTFAFSYYDDSSTFVSVGTPVVVSNTFPSQWYNLAAIGDGTNVRIYLYNTGTQHYDLIGLGLGGGLLNVDSTWTIGRGWFNAPADWTDSEIDEVRISDTALPLGQLLFAEAVPEPTSLGLLGAAGLILGMRARRR